jgi:hypothetical protein
MATPDELRITRGTPSTAPGGQPPATASDDAPGSELFATTTEPRYARVVSAFPPVGGQEEVSVFVEGVANDPAATLRSLEAEIVGMRIIMSAMPIQVEKLTRTFMRPRRRPVFFLPVGGHGGGGMSGSLSTTVRAFSRTLAAFEARLFRTATGVAATDAFIPRATPPLRLPFYRPRLTEKSLQHAPSRAA